MISILTRLTNLQFLLLIVLTFLFLSFSLFLTWPVPWPDEVHFADTARTLGSEGHLGTNLIKGMEDHVYWQPPVYFLVLAPVIRLVGLDIVFLRSFSILIGLGILLVTFRIAGSLSQDTLVPRLSVLFLALNPLFVNFVKLVRMDGLCVLLTLMAVFALQKQKKSWIAGAFLSLACLTHLLGLIGVVACSLWMLLHGLREGRWNRLTSLLVPVVIGFAAWGLYILQDTQAFQQQMAFQFARKGFAAGESAGQFVKSFRSMPIWFLATLFGLVWVWRQLLLNASLRLLFWLLAIALLVVALTYEFTYHLYILPYAAIVASMMFTVWCRSTTKRWIGSTLVIVLIVNCALYFGYAAFLVHFKVKDGTNYDALSLAVSQHLTTGNTVMLSGYPSLFWGLQRVEKQFTFVEPVFLDEQGKSDAIKSIRYLVFTRAYDPRKDSGDLLDKVVGITNDLPTIGKELRHRASVGMKREYAYSAEVFEVIPMKRVQEFR